MSNANDIELLVRAQCPLIYIETEHVAQAKEILRSIADKLVVPLAFWTATGGLRTDRVERAVSDTQKAVDVLSFIAHSAICRVYLLNDFHHFLKDPVTVQELKSLVHTRTRKLRPIIIAAPRFAVPDELMPKTKHIKLELATEEELERLANKVIEDSATGFGLLAPFTEADQRALVRELKGMTFARAKEALTKRVLGAASLRPTRSRTVTASKTSLLKSGSFAEYYPALTTFDDLAGVKRLKDWIRTRAGFMQNDDAACGSDSPKGILILGARGSGKSSCAKAIAHEWRRPLVKLNLITDYRKNTGESGERLLKAMAMTESVAPAVLWIDKIESQIPAGRLLTGDLGFSERVLQTFFAWLRNKQAPVFVVATSNNLKALPPALLGDGLFDEVFFVDLPAFNNRSQLFRLHLLKRGVDVATLDLVRLARLAVGFSGAEIEQTVISAFYDAFSKSGVVTTELIESELRTNIPLSRLKPDELQALRRWAAGRAVFADEPGEQSYPSDSRILP